jgi:glycerol transport system ATP-binding protein
VVSCEVKDGMASVEGHPVETLNASAYKGHAKRLELGVRPEFVSLAKAGIPATVAKVADAGRFRIVETRAGHRSIKLLLPESEAVPEGQVHLAFDPKHTQVYEDGWMVGARR